MTAYIHSIGQDESQKNLSKWSEEEWQTKEGSGNAKQDDGTQKRYLPKKAWEQMDESEKEATDEKKQAGSKKGKQFVGNTDKAKSARQNANEEEDEQFDAKKGGQTKAQKAGKETTEGVKTKGKGNKGQQEEDEEDAVAEKQEGDDAGVVHDEGDAEDDEEFVDDDEADDDDEEDDVVEDEDEKEVDDGDADEKPARGQKRGRGNQKSQGGQNKKQKVNGTENEPQNAAEIGSKHDNHDEPAPAGSATRLPNVGQRVSWKALPGWVNGKVIEVVTEEKDVQGQHIKGSKKDPRLALEADSGKICQHKPATTYFEDA